ncbi:hypothetical protein KUV85_13990 [Nocardioides panacisoli]|uniref:hypothetical protein n=1 Tax=Nocardioides panacisoli TaxID=627624 RepID=UPI001C62940A|nr:hypothetical protein [Nocardioides panacisoli]QYJ03430.1 hypothetical protein KUV85_13990 [Nocardioides panacisoli]
MTTERRALVRRQRRATSARRGIVAVLALAVLASPALASAEPTDESTATPATPATPTTSEDATEQPSPSTPTETATGGGETPLPTETGSPDRQGGSVEGDTEPDSTSGDRPQPGQGHGPAASLGKEDNPPVDDTTNVSPGKPGCDLATAGCQFYQAPRWHDLNRWSDTALASVRWGDIDGDGHPEVIARRSDKFEVWSFSPTVEGQWCQINGVGCNTFVPLVNGPPTTGLPWDAQAAAALQFADLDGDGRDELLVAVDEGGDYRLRPYRATIGRSLSVTWHAMPESPKLGDNRGTAAVHPLPDTLGKGRDALWAPTSGDQLTMAYWEGDAASGLWQTVSVEGIKEQVTAIYRGDYRQRGWTETVVVTPRYYRYVESTRDGVPDRADSGFGPGSSGDAVHASLDISGDGVDQLLRRTTGTLTVWNPARGTSEARNTSSRNDTFALASADLDAAMGSVRGHGQAATLVTYPHPDTGKDAIYLLGHVVRLQANCNRCIRADLPSFEVAAPRRGDPAIAAALEHAWVTGKRIRAVRKEAAGLVTGAWYPGRGWRSVASSEQPEFSGEDAAAYTEMNRLVNRVGKGIRSIYRESPADITHVDNNLAKYQDPTHRPDGVSEEAWRRVWQQVDQELRAAFEASRYFTEIYTYLGLSTERAQEIHQYLGATLQLEGEKSVTAANQGAEIFKAVMEGLAVLVKPIAIATDVGIDGAFSGAASVATLLEAEFDDQPIRAKTSEILLKLAEEREAALSRNNAARGMVVSDYSAMMSLGGLREQGLFEKDGALIDRLRAEQRRQDWVNAYQTLLPGIATFWACTTKLDFHTDPDFKAYDRCQNDQLAKKPTGWKTSVPGNRVTKRYDQVLYLALQSNKAFAFPTFGIPLKSNDDLLAHFTTTPKDTCWTLWTKDCGLGFTRDEVAGGKQGWSHVSCQTVVGFRLEFRFYEIPQPCQVHRFPQGRKIYPK